MADPSSSTQKVQPTSGETPLRRNSDPALEPQHQHHHEHLHHSPRIDAMGGHDDVTYSKGTNPDDVHIPPQSPLHRHSEERQLGIEDRQHGVEKAQTSTTTPPDYSDHEKGEPVLNNDGEGSTHRRRGKLGILYRHHRILIHIFVFCLFT